MSTIQNTPDGARYLFELSDIEDAMAAAGHHGPLRDTIPRLIADVEAQRKNLVEARRVIAAQNRPLELADQLECRVRSQRDEARADRDEAERRASWVLREAMAYCVRDLVANDD